jgi:hypothetical protein
MSPQVGHPRDTLVTVHIGQPDGTSPVSNPISAIGTASPSTTAVTAWIIDGGGNTLNGTVVKTPHGGWSATFGPAQAGAGSVNAMAQNGTDSATDTVPVTIQ